MTSLGNVKTVLVRARLQGVGLDALSEHQIFAPQKFGVGGLRYATKALIVQKLLHRDIVDAIKVAPLYCYWATIVVNSRNGVEFQQSDYQALDLNNLR